MTTESIETTVQILGQNYQIRCSAAEVDMLQHSARMLENKMQTLRDNSHNFSTDRIAIITGLNLAHELLLQQSKQNTYLDTINQRLQALQKKLENALG